jgi:hypothetical protein
MKTLRAAALLLLFVFLKNTIIEGSYFLRRYITILNCIAFVQWQATAAAQERRVE